MGYAHGVKWTNELIKEKVLEVKEKLGLDRMPSRSECERYFQNTALTNAISKRIGWYQLADEMGLPKKKSETLLGKAFEAKAAKILEAKGFDVRQMPQNFPYDLLIDSCIKVDVKTSRLYRGKEGNFYTYNMEKPFATCDVYLLFELDQADDIKRVMVIPSKFVISNNQISVGETNSKYHKFTDRWDYILQMSEFWNKAVI